MIVKPGSTESRNMSPSLSVESLFNGRATDPKPASHRAHGFFLSGVKGSDLSHDVVRKHGVVVSRSDIETSLAGRIHQVVGLSCGEEVVRSNAGRIVAAMAHKKSMRNRSNTRRVGITSGHDGGFAFVRGEMTPPVASLSSPPHPARTEVRPGRWRRPVLVNTLPECDLWIGTMRRGEARVGTEPARLQWRLELPTASVASPVGSPRHSVSHWRAVSVSDCQIAVES